MILNNNKSTFKKSVLGQNKLSNNGLSLPTEATEQIKALGFTDSDRVWFRALLPKQLDADTAYKMGLGWKNKEGRLVKQSHEFYFENRQLWQKWGKENYKPVPTETLKRVNDQGFGIYLVVNKGGTSDKQITSCHNFFYECDDISKEEQWYKVKEVEKTLGVTLTVVESGKSLHPYTHLDQPLTDTDQWRTYQKRLIIRQNSDKAIHNPARLMRVAGFDHKTWNGSDFVSTPVVLRQVSSDKVSLQQIDNILPFLPEVEKKEYTFTGVNGGKDDGLSMLNLAEYQDHYNPNGRTGWATFACPVHTKDGQSHSNDHIHVHIESGAFNNHCGCSRSAIWYESLQVAVDRGYKIPALTKEQKKVVKAKTREKFKGLYGGFRGFGQYKPTHTQNNDRLVLPELKKPLTFISSACKTGKTTALVGEIRKRAAKGERIVWITYRNALAYQTCKKAHIPHIHEFNSDSDRVSYASAFACCPDSLHLLRISSIKEPFFVVIDEADATLKHLLYGETMGEEHERKLAHFRATMKRIVDMGGQIILMEDSLTHTMIDQYRKIIGEAIDYDFVVNEKFLSKYPVKKIGGGSPAGLNDQIIRDLAVEKTIALVSDSQSYLETLERLIETYNPDLKIIRVDSRTVAEEEIKDFMKDPDQVIDQEKPNAIFLSPTAESGVSIESEAIDCVYAYFTHSDPRQMIQMLERVRTDVPRYIYCRDYCPGADGIKKTNPQKLLEQLREAHRDTIHRCQLIAKQKQFNQQHGLTSDVDPILLNLNMQDNDEDHRIFNEAYSFFKARENAAKAAVLSNLIDELQRRGIEIESLEDWEHDQGTAQDFKAAKYEVEIDYSCTVAGANETLYTVEEARKLKQSNSLSKEDAAVVEKILLMDALPGYPMSDPEAVHYVTQKRGKNRKRATRLFHAVMPQIAYERDTAYNVRKLQRSSTQMYHKSPNYGRKAGVDNALMPLIVKCFQEDYNANTPFIIQFSDLLVQYADELESNLHLKFEKCRPEIRDENGKKIQAAVTPITNVNKYLRSFGVEPVQRNRYGSRKSRLWSYRAVVTENMSMVLLAMLEKYKEELAQDKDSKAVSSGFNYLSLLLNPEDTENEPSEKRLEISTKLLNFINELTPIPLAV